MPGSGKSVVSEAARSLGIPVLVMGDVVREEARRRGIEPTPRNLVELARRLREEYGEAVIAERLAERVRELLGKGHRVVVVDGVRSRRELQVFEKVARTVTIAVHASPRTRFERLRRRGRPDDPKTWEEFRRRDEVELGFGLGEVIALADYMIVNEGGYAEARMEAEKLLRRVLECGEDKG